MSSVIYVSELLCQREHEKRDTVLPKIDFVNRGKQLILSGKILSTGVNEMKSLTETAKDAWEYSHAVNN